MKISVLKNAIVVEVGDVKHIDSSKSFSFILNQESGSITVEKEREWIATAKLEETTVNGTQLTAGNAESVLASLIPAEGCCCGGGSSSSIIYVSDVAQLPATADIDDLAALTSDGTENGELLELYRWNGFEWNLESMKANLIIKDTGLTEWDIYTTSIDNAVIKTLRANEKKYYLIKSSNDQPVYMSQTGTLEGLPKIYNSDDSFYFNSMSVALTEKENYISNIFSNNAYTELNVNTNNYQSPITDKIFSFTDSYADIIQISDSSIKSVLLQNLKNPGVCGSINLYKSGYESVTIDNVTGYITIDINTFYNENVVPNVERQVSISNVKLTNGYFALAGFSKWESNLIDEVSLSLKNMTFSPSLRIYNCQINNISFDNCIADDLSSIQLLQLAFKDQNVCDSLFNELLEIVSAGANILVTSKNFVPSQSIQDAIRAKGISLNITIQG